MAQPVVVALVCSTLVFIHFDITGACRTSRIKQNCLKLIISGIKNMESLVIAKVTRINLMTFLDEGY